MTSTQDRIRDLLATRGAMTVLEISAATSIKSTTVRAALESGSGLVIAGKRNNARLYALPGMFNAPNNLNICRPYVAEFKTLTVKDHDMRSGAALALAGPR